MQINKLRVEPIKTYSGFLSLKPVWNNLLAKSDMDVPFMTFEWFALWQKLYCKESEMLILAVKDVEGVRAIVPLKKERKRMRGLPVNTVIFMANYISTRTGIITDGSNQDIFGAVLDYLAECDYKYDLLYLDLIVKDSTTDRQIRKEISERNLSCREMEGSNSPFLKIEGDWPSYLQKRSKNFRSNLRNKNNILVKEGNCEIILYKNEGYERILSEIFEISRKSWQNTTNTGVAGNERSVEFYTSLAKMLAEMDWLAIWIMYVDKQPAAFILNIEYKGKVYGKQLGYDYNYRRFSPAYMLIVESIKDAFEKHYSEYDMLGEDEPFKLDFTSTRRPHVKYFIFSSTMSGKMLYFIETKLIQKLVMLKQQYLRHKNGGNSN